MALLATTNAAALIRRSRSWNTLFLWLYFGSYMLSALHAQQNPDSTEKKFAIAIHGGAGGDPSKWSSEYQSQRRTGLQAALDHGVALLEKRADALDVVEAVVRILEDDATFNAGRGCVLNENGEHELDASIMDGRNLQCGAVAAVKRAKNPVSLARLVMTQTKHVLLIGSGADQFGEATGVEQAEPDYFLTEQRKASWQKWKLGDKDALLHAPSTHKGEDEQLYLGTVGCVVLDVHGNLAAATSTGGLMGKRWGRVGDSPIVGAGNYADNETCAISGTGIGEEFIRRAVASDIAARMRYGHNTLAEAVTGTLTTMPAESGGVIAVDARGNVVMEFNTPGMSRATADSLGNRGVWLGRND
ncbi:MAG: isoaspartyl peptidase/L-asparaginase [Planctomycetales bacterium]|nr:isoaspartyl peptidase/L-asparaginase [Planctomycetales bacterium]